MKRFRALCNCICEQGIPREFLIDFDKCLRFAPRRFNQSQILKRFHADVGNAPLLAPPEFAGTPLEEVLLGEFKSVFCGSERFEPCERALAARFGADKTICLMRASYH